MASPSAVELSSINHLALQTPDVERLAGFYQAVLGFRKLMRPFDGLFEGAWLSGGGTMIHLIHVNAYERIQDLLRKSDPERLKRDYALPHKVNAFPADRSVDGRTPLGDHLAFAVPDMEVTRQRLNALGIQFFSIADKMQDHVWIRDPDGRAIELTRDDAPPPFEEEVPTALAAGDEVEVVNRADWKWHSCSVIGPGEASNVFDVHVHALRRVLKNVPLTMFRKLQVPKVGAASRARL